MTLRAHRAAGLLLVFVVCMAVSGMPAAARSLKKGDATHGKVVPQEQPTSVLQGRGARAKRLMTKGAFKANGRSPAKLKNQPPALGAGAAKGLGRTRRAHAAQPRSVEVGEPDRLAQPASSAPVNASLASSSSSANAWLAALRIPVAALVPPGKPLRSTSARMPDLRSYEAVRADYERPRDIDPRLLALLATIRGAIAKNDLAPIAAALAPNFEVIECDSDATRPCPVGAAGASNRRRLQSVARLEPEQRLLLSMCCSDMRPHDVPGRLRRDAVLDLLGAATENDSLGINPDMPDRLCAPAQPIFDRDKALLMAANADTEPSNLRVASQELIVRQRPARDAAEAGRIPPRQIIPLVTDLPKPLPDGWTAVALPQGQLGYAELQGAEELVTNGACFAKDPAGAWQIISVVRRHRWGGLG